MDLPHLRAFVALAELQHFGRAADRLHITQPALTKRLRLLEDVIGARLFERDRTGTVLTSIGKALLPDALRIITEADALLIRARHVVQGTAGRLDIGFGLSSIDMAPWLVSAYRRTHPEVSVSLNDFSSTEQIERLRDGRLDVGFVRLPLASAGLKAKTLGRDTLALACPKGCPSSGHLSDLDALNAIGFVMLDRKRGPGLRAQIDRWCAVVGLEPRILQIADDLQTVLALVAAGVGLSIVPQRAVRLSGPGADLFPLTGEHAEWVIGAAWRSDRDNPALWSFLALIEQAWLTETTRAIDISALRP
ncbi:LysR family transcriptional regulator [Xanthomonas sp. A1809]|uniref:LysR family transcriptional regulator n=1 Tax=Xanthomonas sp. A1809 TaxID=2821275 RepID=UPI001ADC11BF|nr:LysR family transcriptional regulator [Xanthomonas sp. A1809]MBO9858828.1 LysR family transcriptional regulator [Xanthomonas sp. A1809]